MGFAFLHLALDHLTPLRLAVKGYFERLHFSLLSWFSRQRFHRARAHSDYDRSLLCQQLPIGLSPVNRFCEAHVTGLGLPPQIHAVEHHAGANSIAEKRRHFQSVGAAGEEDNFSLSGVVGLLDRYGHQVCLVA